MWPSGGNLGDSTRVVHGQRAKGGKRQDLTLMPVDPDARVQRLDLTLVPPADAALSSQFGIVAAD
jgi:hypothetical protein